MTLKDLKVGQSATIANVAGEGALRLRLLDMGLIPGTKVLLQKVLSFNGFYHTSFMEGIKGINQGYDMCLH